MNQGSAGAQDDELELAFDEMRAAAQDRIAVLAHVELVEQERERGGRFVANPREGVGRRGVDLGQRAYDHQSPGLQLGEHGAVAELLAAEIDRAGSIRRWRR